MNVMIQECAKLAAVHMKDTAESKTDENIKKYVCPFDAFG